jgi:hypothetical protein
MGNPSSTSSPSSTARLHANKTASAPAVNSATRTGTLSLPIANISTPYRRFISPATRRSLGKILRMFCLPVRDARRLVSSTGERSSMETPPSDMSKCTTSAFFWSSSLRQSSASCTITSNPPSTTRKIGSANRKDGSRYGGSTRTETDATSNTGSNVLSRIAAAESADITFNVYTTKRVLPQ